MQGDHLENYHWSQRRKDVCWIRVGAMEMNGKTERTEKVPELNAEE